MVRGPTNWCKDGACPLDAIIETDWAVSSFTMNWKITRANWPIRFDQGEPICMIFPQRRELLDGVDPEIRMLSENPVLQEKYLQWRKSRDSFLGKLIEKVVGGDRSPWQKHYYRGTTPTGEPAPDHQMRLSVKPFRRPVKVETGQREV